MGDGGHCGGHEARAVAGRQFVLITAKHIMRERGASKPTATRVEEHPLGVVWCNVIGVMWCDVAWWCGVRVMWSVV